ncbi:MAG: hypothetical protein AAB401_03640, partial [Acidobacteriota bacterium]
KVSGGDRRQVFVKSELDRAFVCFDGYCAICHFDLIAPFAILSSGRYALNAALLGLTLTACNCLEFFQEENL